MWDKDLFAILKGVQSFGVYVIHIQKGYADPKQIFFWEKKKGLNLNLNPV